MGEITVVILHLCIVPYHAFHDFIQLLLEVSQGTLFVFILPLGFQVKNFPVVLQFAVNNRLYFFEKPDF